MKSRHASAAGTSTSALPTASRAPATASPGRSNVFEGMQPQYVHRPPTSSALHDRNAQAPLRERVRTMLARGAGA